MDLGLLRGCQLVFILALYFSTSESQQMRSPGQHNRPTCGSPLSSIGICTPLRQCSFLSNILYRAPIRGRQIIRSSLCYPHRANPLVCCPLFKKTQNSVPKKHTPTKPSTHTPPKQTTPKPNDDGDMNAYAFPADHAQNPTQCGFSGKAFDKIVGGVSSTPGAWPWIANLGYVSKNGYEYLCGGSLISSRHVVTAAHCVHERNDLKIVRLGEHDLKSDKDGAHPINVQIQKKVAHPRFDSRTNENDIAILTLDRDVKFTDEIHPICLPSSNKFRMEDIENTNPFVAGWGAVQFRGPPSSILKETQVLVVNTDSCKKSYKGLLSHIDDKVICAGTGGTDSCQGDSGGPLMAPENSIFHLIGVVSFGYKCAEPGYPGIYTRVTSFLDFIESNTR